MLGDDFLILPRVKNTVGKLAALARSGLMLCVLLGIAEILCCSYAFPIISVTCGVLSCTILNLELCILSFLSLWCHDVLLPQRGFDFTRFLGYLSVFFALISPACVVYTALTGKLLLLNQALLPFMVCALLQVSLLFNFPNMNAASFMLKIRLEFFPLLTAAIFLFDHPNSLPIAVTGKLLLLLLMAHPLRSLANIAPRIISMPEKEESADE